MPRSAAKPKSARFEGRMSPFALEMVKRAAEIQGRSVSDFIATAAQEVAERTVQNTQVLKLSLEDQRAFVEALINPSEPSPAWQRAREAHRRLIKKSL